MIRLLLSKTVLCICIMLAPTIAQQLKACTGYDIMFTNITFTSINSTYTYSYEIKNIGTTAVPINKITIQNYVSTDNVIGQDLAAGGSLINYPSSGTIAAGATYSGTQIAYPYPATSSTHPYIIIQLSISPDSDCDLTNNEYISLIPTIPTAIRGATFADATLIWNNETKDFSVFNWTGNSKTLQYTLFSISGLIMRSGFTAEEQNTPIDGLKEDIYILYLYDGEKIYSKKIIY